MDKQSGQLPQQRTYSIPYACYLAVSGRVKDLAQLKANASPFMGGESPVYRRGEDVRDGDL